MLAVAIRDAIWFKPKVVAFLKTCHIPTPIERNASRELQTEKRPTVQVIPEVVDQLQRLGAQGELPIRTMFTQMCSWKDFASLKPEQRDTAKNSVAELKAAFDQYAAEREFLDRRQREQYQAKAQAERVDRVAVKTIAPGTLQKFLDPFDSVYALHDEQKRGLLFQDLMNEIFGLYATLSKGPFTRTGEQIDGHFYLDNHPYFVEIRWKRKKTNAADISVLRDRASDGFGGDTKGLFISFEGFSEDALKRL